ncbi:MAG: hypothetical protein LIP23_03725 [Planctomycetes bacterium]|nr:hypothetical protein [Planctomycetota bacterium]
MDEIQQKKIMREAVQAGLTVVRNGSGEPFGAAVARKDTGEIIAVAGNQNYAEKHPNAHAELLAINRACASLGVFNLAGYAVYASGQPCILCLAAMVLSGIDTVYYANTHAQCGFDAGPGVRALTSIFGATGADPDKFASGDGLTIIHLPIPEAAALLCGHIK